MEETQDEEGKKKKVDKKREKDEAKASCKKRNVCEKERLEDNESNQRWPLNYEGLGGGVRREKERKRRVLTRN